MSKAAGRTTPFSGEVVRLYEEGTNHPSKDARRALALAFGREEPYIEFGGYSKKAQSEDRAKDAKEEILLYLYRGLFTLQQARLIQNLRALFDANQITRKELGQTPLRGVSDQDVVRAFGKTPPPKGSRKKTKRELGDAMGDFLD